ncbi:DUF2569 domain-containing protein [Paenibacillus faecis]|uniref:DUF2569 domain-containing protein n=1 Tax=Paenibacillus faecis TaxID=862114 RepID=UPI001BCB10AB|nr:DUF2569 domain-containing protein [Paenibacillus faecis]
MMQMQNNLPTEPPNYSNLGVSGLGGWLVLVQISLYATILMLLARIREYVSGFLLNPESWSVLTTPSSPAYHPLWGPAIIFEAVYFVSMFIFCIMILIMFYSKKRVLPRLMIIAYSAGLLFGIIDTVLIFQIPMPAGMLDASSIREVVKSAIICAIWIPYFLKSERVKNTFIW